MGARKEIPLDPWEKTPRDAWLDNKLKNPPRGTPDWEKTIDNVNRPRQGIPQKPKFAPKNSKYYDDLIKGKPKNFSGAKKPSQLPNWARKTPRPDKSNIFKRKRPKNAPKIPSQKTAKKPQLGKPFQTTLDNLDPTEIIAVTGGKVIAASQAGRLFKPTEIPREIESTPDNPIDSGGRSGIPDHLEHLGHTTGQYLIEWHIDSSNVGGQAGPNIKTIVEGRIYGLGYNETGNQYGLKVGNGDRTGKSISIGLGMADSSNMRLLAKHARVVITNIEKLDEEQEPGEFRDPSRRTPPKRRRRTPEKERNVAPEIHPPWDNPEKTPPSHTPKIPPEIPEITPPTTPEEEEGLEENDHSESEPESEQEKNKTPEKTPATPRDPGSQVDLPPTLENPGKAPTQGGTKTPPQTPTAPRSPDIQKPPSKNCNCSGLEKGEEPMVVKFIPVTVINPDTGLPTTVDVLAGDGGSSAAATQLMFAGLRNQNTQRTTIQAQVTANNGLLVINNGIASATQTAVNAANATLTTLQGIANKTLSIVNAIVNNSFVQKAINVMNLIVSITILMHLTRDVGEVLADTVQLVAKSLGFKLTKIDEDGNEVEVQLWDVVSGTVNSIIQSIVGAENLAAIQVKLASLNRIYHAASSVLDSTMDWMNTTWRLAEITVGNIGKVGNALKKSGQVFEDAYETLEETFWGSRPQRFQKLRKHIENLEDGADVVASVANTKIAVGDAKKEIEEEFDNLVEITQEANKDVTEEILEQKEQSTVEIDLGDVRIGNL